MDHNPVYNLAANLPDEYRTGMEDYFNSSPGTAVWKLQNFCKYVPRQELTRFLVRTELFKKVLHVQGSIVECGVLAGAGLMAWAQLSAIFEHLNYQRKVIGFDTFEGFTQLTDTDKSGTSPAAREGGLALDSCDDIMESVRLYNLNRLVLADSKVRLVKGDACNTIPRYLEDYPETVVSLLYLDFDVELPTRTALDYFLPRMPKGAVIAFDELNDRGWPGETVAALDIISGLRLQRFTYDTKICYAVLE